MELIVTETSLLVPLERASSQHYIDMSHKIMIIIIQFVKRQSAARLWWCWRTERESC